MTSAPPRTDAVSVLDLRDWRDSGTPDVAGRVVVVDDVGGVRAHEHVYQALTDNVFKVHGLILIVVGRPAGAADHVSTVVETPPRLPLNVGAILWVGDEHGVLWGPADGHPTAAPAQWPSGLDRLVEALRVPRVFDGVVEAAENFPDRASNPGHLTVSGAVDPDDLQVATATVVRQFVSLDPPQIAMPQELADPTRFAAEQTRTGPVLVDHAPIKAAEARFHAAMEKAEEGAQIIPGLGALLRRSRPGEAPTVENSRPGKWLAGMTEDAGRFAEEYRTLLVELLRRVDGNLRVGQPSVQEVTELGVRPPVPIRPAEIAAKTDETVGGALAAGVPLPVLASALRQASATAAPQGCARAWEQLARHDVIGRRVPPFRYRPLWLWTIPLIVLSTFLAAFAPPQDWGGIVAGVLVAGLWFGAGYFLLARRPSLEGELGFHDALRPSLFAYLLPGVLGAGIGVLLASWLRDRLWFLDLFDVGWFPTGYVVLVLAISLLLFAVPAGLAWPTAARRWVRGMRLAELRAEVKHVADVAAGAVLSEWQPAERRRAVSAAFAETATGLEEVAERLPELGTEAPVRNSARADGMPNPLLVELQDVVRGDVLAVVREALKPAWSVIGEGRRNAPGVYAQRTGNLVGSYQAHVRREGLLSLPPEVTDSAPRDRLVARQWENAPKAVDAMRAGAFDEMTQLCRHEDLTVIDQQAENRLVRFAPKPVERVMLADRVKHRAALAGRPIWTDSGSLVGVLRLLPLRVGSVDSTPRSDS